jgi:hypothetical protein
MNTQHTFTHWTPPPGFEPVPSQVPGIEVYAPLPPEEQAPEATTFRCPQCAGVIAYSAGDRQLACPYCGYKQEVGAPRVGLSAERFEFTLQTLGASEKGWGTERQEIHCQACQALYTQGGGELSTTCPFCGSNRVAGQAALHEHIRPGYLIPFVVDAERCRAEARAWLSRGWMHPPALRRTGAVDRFTGLYLPFWVFDARIEAQWKAEVGYEREERRYRDGEWETETVIDWRWESGHVRYPVDHLLVYGTETVSTTLLERLYPYDLQALTAYDPAYLAGWQAQAYDMQLQEAWDVGKSRSREQARQACRADIPSAHVRNFGMTAEFEDERWRYVLLPVYLASYGYRGKTYQLMVNGQTGALAGYKPVDWLRVWLVLGAILLPGILGGLIGLLTLPLGVGAVILPIALVLFVAGLIATIVILRRAMQSTSDST